MRATWFVVMAATAVACKKDGAAKGGTSASTAAVDALWALAPAGTEVGVVASPRALGLLDGAKARMQENLATIPELKQLAGLVEEGVRGTFGSTDLDLAAHGLSVDKGAASFATKDGNVHVLPVVDRDRFVAWVKGAKNGDVDTFADMTCKTVQGVYACAKPASLLDGLGKRGMAGSPKLIGVRGDIEVAGSFPGPKGTLPFALAVKLERGAATVDFAIRGVKDLMPMEITGGARPRVDEHTVGFGVFELGGLLSRAPPVPLVPGVTAEEIARTVNGPITVKIAAGSTVIEGRVPLSDPAPAKAFIEQCNVFAPLQQLGATVEKDTCHVAIPQMLTELDAWVEGKELRFGKRGAAPAAAANVSMSPIARELAGQTWAMLFYGRGTIFAVPQLPPMPMNDLPDMAATFVRVFSLINELGLGMRMDGDTLRVALVARTAWANPDDVVAKLRAIPVADIISGKSQAAAKAIADAAKDSPFADDMKAGFTGLMIPTTAVGMMAAVAIPAFMQYMEKSKASEASIQLNKLGKNLKTYYVTTGGVPVGTAPLTPAQSCCDGPNHKCHDPAAWAKDPVWKELEFSIDEPGLYRYEYTSTDGKTFEAHAVSDLDCDGNPATWILRGQPEGDTLKVELLQPRANVY
jgi:type IV pilus assembly protein PilA